MGRFINADGIIGTQENENAYNLYAYTGNNPINLKDLDGYGPTVAAFAGATSIIMYILIGYAFYTVAKYTAQVIAQTVSDVSTNSYAGEKTKKSSAKKKHTVYTLKKGKKVIYVGRTINPTRRMKQHKKNVYRKNLKFEVFKSDLTKEEARGLEQALILKHESLNRDDKAANQINGIAWDNPKCRDYMSSIIGTFMDENEVYVGYCK